MNDNNGFVPNPEEVKETAETTTQETVETALTSDVPTVEEVTEDAVITQIVDVSNAEEVPADNGVAEAPQTQETIPVTPERCPRCQGLLEPGKLFCPECGANVSGGTNPQPISAIENYNKQLVATKGNKRKIIIAAILTVVVIGLAVGGYILYQNQVANERRKDVLECIDVYEDFIEEIDSAYSDLYLIDCMWDYVRGQSYYLKSYNRTLLSDEISSMKAAKPRIQELYAEIDGWDINDKYVKQMKKYAKESYDLFIEIYDADVIGERGDKSSEVSELLLMPGKMEEVVDNIQADYGAKVK